MESPLRANIAYTSARRRSVLRGVESTLAPTENASHRVHFQRSLILWKRDVLAAMARPDPSDARRVSSGKKARVRSNGILLSRFLLVAVECFPPRLFAKAERAATQRRRSVEESPRTKSEGRRKTRVTRNSRLRSATFWAANSIRARRNHATGQRWARNEGDAGRAWRRKERRDRKKCSEYRCVVYRSAMLGGRSRGHRGHFNG